MVKETVRSSLFELSCCAGEWVSAPGIRSGRLSEKKWYSVSSVSPGALLLLLKGPLIIRRQTLRWHTFIWCSDSYQRHQHHRLPPRLLFLKNLVSTNKLLCTTCCCSECSTSLSRYKIKVFLQSMFVLFAKLCFDCKEIFKKYEI